MTSRGIRRKKSSLSEVKVAVIGAPSVGKSALTVRFLTRRYIGEYDHQQDNRYKHEVLLDGEPILFEILDTCPKSIEDLPSSELMQWADGLFMVYSITDRNSFNYVRRSKQYLQSDIPLTLVGNKGDMVHLRQAGLTAMMEPLSPREGPALVRHGTEAVAEAEAERMSIRSASAEKHIIFIKRVLCPTEVSYEEGEILAKDFECSFAEVAAAEQVGQIGEVFHELCREVLAVRRKSKHSLLDRMLGGKSAAVKAYSRGKSDSALPKD